MRTRLRAVLFAGVLAGAGCGGPRAFVADQSVHITSPKPLATVSTPFRAAWTTSDDRDERYAVFIDRNPMPPGHTMRDLASEECKRRPDCYPDMSYLNGLGVYLTSANDVTVPVLRPLGGLAAKVRPPLRTMTIVRFDGHRTRGKRIGDSAWQVEFRGE